VAAGPGGGTTSDPAAAAGADVTAAAAGVVACLLNWPVLRDVSEISCRETIECHTSRDLSAVSVGISRNLCDIHTNHHK